MNATNGHSLDEDPRVIRIAQEYLAELEAGRAPDRAWLHFLRPNVAVEVDLTPSLIESPEQTVRDFQEAQSKLLFPLLEGDHCKRCPYYRDLCPAGQS